MNPAQLVSKQKNARKILNYLIRNGETSRAVLAASLGLSTGTVTNIVGELIEQQLLCEGRRESAPAGRKTTLLKFNEEKAAVLTCDLLESDRIVLTAGTLLGRELFSRQLDCELTVSEHRSDLTVIREVIRAVTDFRDSLPEKLRSSLCGAGLCIGGMVNSGRRIDAPRNNWENLNLILPMEAALGIPVYAEGVTRIKALYEMRFIDRNERNVIYLNLATGIGMVHIFDGIMIRGKTGIAGEIGHISLNVDGPRCYCGNNGCFEYYCGMTRILERAGRLRETAGHGDPFYQMTVQQKRELTPELLFEAYEKGSLAVGELMKSVIRYLGVGLAALYNIYDPDRIVLAGYCDVNDDQVILSAVSEARSRIINKFTRNFNITRAHLKNSGQQLATSAYVLERYLDTLYP